MFIIGCFESIQEILGLVELIDFVGVMTDRVVRFDQAERKDEMRNAADPVEMIFRFEEFLRDNREIIDAEIRAAADNIDFFEVIPVKYRVCPLILGELEETAGCVFRDDPIAERG